MAPTSTRLERTERLARAVGRLRRTLVARAAGVMEAQGVPLVQWQLISAIAYEGLYSQVALAERVGMDPAGTSRALDALEHQGLVTRERSAGDRRRFSLALTAKGQRWYAKARFQVMAQLDPIFASLTAAQARQLEGLLSRVTGAATSESIRNNEDGP